MTTMMNFNDPRLPEHFWNQHRIQEDGCWVPSVEIKHPTGRHPVYVKALHRYARYNYRHTAHLVHGPLPKGLGVSHLCRNKACCNPAHLTYESNAKNMARERKYEAPLDMPKEEYVKVKNQGYYGANREEIIAKATAYKKANPEKHRADSLRWYYANKAKKPAPCERRPKRSSEEKKQIARDYAQRYYAENTEKAKAAAKRYYHENKEKIAQKAREKYHANKGVRSSETQPKKENK